MDASRRIMRHIRDIYMGMALNLKDGDYKWLYTKKKNGSNSEMSPLRFDLLQLNYIKHGKGCIWLLKRTN